MVVYQEFPCGLELGNAKSCMVVSNAHDGLGATLATSISLTDEVQRR